MRNKLFNILFVILVMAFTVNGTCNKEKSEGAAVEDRAAGITEENAIQEADKLLKEINNL